MDKVDGYSAAKKEALRAWSVAEVWLRAVSKAIFDITKDASVSVTTLKQDNMEHGIVYLAAVTTPTSGIPDGCRWVFRALPSRRERSSPFYTRPWYVSAMTFRAFLNYIVRGLQAIRLVFDVRTFRSVCALYLFDLSGEGTTP